MSANVKTAMTGGIVALEIAAAHLRFSRSAPELSRLNTRRHGRCSSLKLRVCDVMLSAKRPRSFLGSRYHF